MQCIDDAWNAHEAELRRWGIDNDSLIVLYDDARWHAGSMTERKGGLMKTMYRIALAVTLLAAQASFAQSPPPVEARELIYCADRMTHEEREAYRARMHAGHQAEAPALSEQDVDAVTAYLNRDFYKFAR
jgi:hypothetical protein